MFRSTCVGLALALAALGCRDDCQVGSTPPDRKITQKLRELMKNAADETMIAVVVFATDERAVPCVNQAIIGNNGPVARGVRPGGPATWAALPVHGIESVAMRADVQRIDASF